jgi:hypothetical protein
MLDNASMKVVPVPLKLSAKSKLSFMMSCHSANKVQRPHTSSHNLTDNISGHLILDPISGLLHDQQQELYVTSTQPKVSACKLFYCSRQHQVIDICSIFDQMLLDSLPEVINSTHFHQ